MPRGHHDECAGDDRVDLILGGIAAERDPARAIGGSAERPQRCARCSAELSLASGSRAASSRCSGRCRVSGSLRRVAGRDADSGGRRCSARPGRGWLLVPGRRDHDRAAWQRRLHGPSRARPRRRTAEPSDMLTTSMPFVGASTAPSIASMTSSSSRRNQRRGSSRCRPSARLPGRHSRCARRPCSRRTDRVRRAVGQHAGAGDGTGDVGAVTVAVERVGVGYGGGDAAGVVVADEVDAALHPAVRRSEHRRVGRCRVGGQSRPGKRPGCPGRRSRRGCSRCRCR